MTAAGVPPVEEGFVGSQGERTWYRVVGTDTGAPPLLMVHGGPGGCWPEGLAVVDHLARDRQVVLYDQLGSGRSDDPADPSRWTLDAFVDELSRVRDHLGLEDIHLFGWSWGGTITTSYALGEVSGLRSLTLLSPVLDVAGWCAEGQRLRDELPARTAAALRRFEDRATPQSPKPKAAPHSALTTDELVKRGRPMQRLFPMLLSRPVQALAAAASRVPPLRRASHELLTLQYVRRHLMRIPPAPPPGLFVMLAGSNGPMYAAMWGPAEYVCTGTLRDVDLTPRLGELTLPVLLTSGRHDEATPALMQSALDELPDGRWEVFEQSAHCAILEEADRYGDVVADFLAGVDA